ncbi:DUF3813 domain-containing protein [Siminovitchia fortis]|uniref:DUF3813 domain-containing protein n=1 Tax=Siminovitchia fortis TaxID=254758 RepID=A0A443J2E5_9BACI|nr:DUF3813 domain-containing protein [Siminovitchia fortis]RWR14533.1 DUF3813 domain-containing protein [Siminovitchia fortis]WHY83573.1 DUF3813 domain-containing protein [Siminovitchia fortis]
MGKDKLFQEARHFVEQALNNTSPKTVEIAKNALSSAYANSTFAQQSQLRELQEQLDRRSNSL